MRWGKFSSFMIIDEFILRLWFCCCFLFARITSQAENCFSETWKKSASYKPNKHRWKHRRQEHNHHNKLINQVQGDSAVNFSHIARQALNLTSSANLFTCRPHLLGLQFLPTAQTWSETCDMLTRAGHLTSCSSGRDFSSHLLLASLVDFSVVNRSLATHISLVVHGTKKKSHTK